MQNDFVLKLDVAKFHPKHKMDFYPELLLIKASVRTTYIILYLILEKWKPLTAFKIYKIYIEYFQEHIISFKNKSENGPWSSGGKYLPTPCKLGQIEIKCAKL